jgi:hypothetical protein
MKVASVKILAAEEKDSVALFLEACDRFRSFAPRTQDDIKCVAAAAATVDRLAWALGFNRAGVANYQAVKRICAKIKKG